MRRIFQTGSRFCTILPLLLLGCGDADQKSRQGAETRAPAAAATKRQFSQVAWDTAFVIGGSPEDTLLLRPRLITARDGYLYAYDYVDARLKAFDRQGNLRWTFGRQGKGPGEFGNTTSLQVDSEGNIWIVDSSTARITQVTQNGELEQMFPFGGELIMRVVPLSRNTLLIPTKPNHFWIAVDDSGTATEQGPLPTPKLEAADPMVRAPFVATSPRNDRWAAIFAWANPLLVYEGKNLRCTGTLVEGAPFPPGLNPNNVVWAVGVAMSDTSMFVLARSQTENERRILDEYSAEDCRYLRTLQLPGLSRL